MRMPFTLLNEQNSLSLLSNQLQVIRARAQKTEASWAARGLVKTPDALNTPNVRTHPLTI